MADADNEFFLSLLDESVGPAPEFATGKDPMGQFYGWIKWSGKKQLADAVRQKLKPDNIPAGTR